MSSQSLKGAAGARSNSHGSRSVDSCQTVDPKDLEKYHEVQQRLATAGALPTAASLPNFVRGMHDFVQLAAARHRSKEMSEADSDLDEASEEALAQQSKRLNDLEGYIFKADVQIQDIRVELVAAEAQNAAQCAEWEDMYFTEVSEARAQRQEADVYEECLEERLQRVAVASIENINMDVNCWRLEAVECDEEWDEQRRVLQKDLCELQGQLLECESLDAGSELQAKLAAQTAAQTAKECANFAESLASIESQIRLANFEVQASDARLAVSEEKERQVVRQVESLTTEQQAVLMEGNMVLAQLYEELSEEGEAMAAALEQMEEWKKDDTSQQEDLVARLKQHDIEQQATQEAAHRLNAEAALMTEQMSEVASSTHKSKNGTSVSIATVTQDVQERLAALSQAVAVSEAASYSEATVERAAMITEQNMSARLRSELLQETRTQRDLHNELQALSSAAASVREVVAVKDMSIANIVTSTHELAKGVAAQLAEDNPAAADVEVNQMTAVIRAMVPGDKPKMGPSRPIYDQRSAGTPSTESNSDIASSAAQRPPSLNEAERDGVINFLRWQTGVGQDMETSTPSSAVNIENLYIAPARGRSPDKMATLPIQAPDRVWPADLADPLGEVLANSRFLASKFGTQRPVAPERVAPDRSGSRHIFNEAGGAAPPRNPVMHTAAAAAENASTYSEASSALQGIEDLVGPSPSGVSPELDANWEQTQSVVTEQLRTDIVLLRKMFSELGVTTGSDAASDCSSKPGVGKLLTRSASPKQGRPRVRLNALSPAAAKKSLGSCPPARRQLNTPGSSVNTPAQPGAYGSSVNVPVDISPPYLSQTGSRQLSPRSNGKVPLPEFSGARPTSPRVSMTAVDSLSQSCRAILARSQSPPPQATAEDLISQTLPLPTLHEAYPVSIDMGGQHAQITSKQNTNAQHAQHFRSQQPPQEPAADVTVQCAPFASSSRAATQPPPESHTRPAGTVQAADPSRIGCQRRPPTMSPPAAPPARHPREPRISNGRTPSSHATTQPPPGASVPSNQQQQQARLPQSRTQREFVPPVFPASSAQQSHTAMTGKTPSQSKLHSVPQMASGFSH